ncbi:HK97 family phage prohead protease [Brevundimonas sp.]|uniref:HK97 family phage prohead protease n=1 Tax=Brevundimonas sp. TaxID=1871086 RepID=UPI00289E59E5|nr:HK97 family phage prohead protease [Brevundimonas sp.]
MLLERKSVSLTDVEVTDEGVISGYGSLFGVRDDYGDEVAPGAFAKSLKARKGKPVPMLREHSPSRVIGGWTEFAEDEKGLKLTGRLALDTVDGAETHRLIKAGFLDGLSIGFNTIRATDDDAGRVLKEVNLWEVSVVTFPALTPARIDAVKAQGLSREDLEDRLTRGADLSRSVARALLAGGFSALQTKRSAGDDAANRLAAAVLQSLQEAN